MAAKDPLNDPSVPDGSVDGVNPASAESYKGFNFDMGTAEHNITCNSCHVGGGAAQFGREGESLDEVLEHRIGSQAFEELKENKNWTVHDEDLLNSAGIDGDLLAYNTYEIAAGYIGKPGVFNFARSGVNDVDCFMCHADASSDKKIKTTLNGVTQEPIMPANPRVMVFKGVNATDNETIVISLGVPPKVGEEIGGKTVSRVDSAYYDTIPIEVLKKLYNLSDADLNNIRSNNETWSRFFIYPNNANGATREVARVTYFEHPASTADVDGGESYVMGGGPFLKDDNGESVYRAFAGFFYKYISTASLMGVDTDGDGIPLAYVRFEKDGDIWKPKVYYDTDEFNANKEVTLPILMSKVDDNYVYTVPELNEDGTVSGDGKYPDMIHGDKDEQWGYVCSYCHMAICYPNPGGLGNFTWVTRKGVLGLGAEIVKRGDVFSYHIHRGNNNGASEISFDNIPIGYDVHFDTEEAGLTCLSCHGEGTLSEEEKELHPIHHDFLKGNDWGGHWDQYLDYNPSLKTCVDCHFEGSKELAAQVHDEYFIVNGTGKAAIHIDKVACEVCHIPYKTHWAFRSFNDAVGYSYNFDNRILNMTDRISPDNFTPTFGSFMPITGYGAPMPYPIARTDNGEDVLVPMYQVDFDPRQAAMRKGNPDMGMWMIPGNAFPWKWEPAIINNGYRPDEPGAQDFKYRIANPLTLVTWYDKSTGKVLYTREMAAALNGTEPSQAAGKNVPAFIVDNGKICVKTILGDLIYDDNGDFLPEISTNEEYEAMKSALAQVLENEGVKEPDPVLYLWVAPFSIDHGVLPKEYALGSNNDYGSGSSSEFGCSQCHDAQNGRLPQANNPSDPAIEKDANGNVVYYGLGRKITLVPFELPERALNEAEKVFFNARNDNGRMTVHAGDLIVNALTNGLDIDRHLVPIPVEDSGVEGVAFAMPPIASDKWINKKWKMKFDGIPVEVETEVLEEGEVPRRASVVRLENELPEMLGLEHLSDEIINAGDRENVEPIITPMALSHYIERLEFKFSDLGVSNIDELYINYAFIKLVRHSEGSDVDYEVDENVFHPVSISARDAINQGLASYSAAEGTFAIDVASLREGAPEGSELALSLVKSMTPSSSTTVTSGGGGGGCSMTFASPISGAVNLGLMLVGLVGVAASRRRFH